MHTHSKMKFFYAITAVNQLNFVASIRGLNIPESALNLKFILCLFLTSVFTK